MPLYEFALPVVACATVFAQVKRYHAHAQRFYDTNLAESCAMFRVVGYNGHYVLAVAVVVACSFGVEKRMFEIKEHRQISLLMDRGFWLQSRRCREPPIIVRAHYDLDVRKATVRPKATTA